MSLPLGYMKKNLKLWLQIATGYPTVLPMNVDAVRAHIIQGGDITKNRAKVPG